MSLIHSCNETALKYWQATGYTSEQLNSACRVIDDKTMVMRVDFLGDGRIAPALSQCTVRRGEGHFPTMIDFFGKVAMHPAMAGKKGAIVVWLEDGLWHWDWKVARSIPLITFGRSFHDNYSFLIPDPAFLGSGGYVHELFDLRKEDAANTLESKKSTIFWRGAATGINIENDGWVNTHRGRFCLSANEVNNPRIVDAKITKFDHLSPEQRVVMTNSNVIGEQVPFAEFLNYRYMVDLDGYHAAWKSLFLKLATNSVVLKAGSEYVQWYFSELKPWTHYVPLSPKLKSAEIVEIHAWLESHFDKSKEIVANAHALLKTITYDDAFNKAANLCAALVSCQRQ